MMDFFSQLPLEILQNIARYLKREDAKQLSFCSSLYYWSMQRKIWYKPRFRNFVFCEELVEKFQKFPIKILHAIDFYRAKNFTIDHLNSCKSLKRFHLEPRSLETYGLSVFIGCSFDIHMNAYCLRNLDAAKYDSILELLKSQQNFYVNFDNYLFHDGFGLTNTKWKVSELKTLIGINIHLFNANVLKYDLDVHKEFYKTINLLQPKVLWFYSYWRYDHGFQVHKTVFPKLCSLNIKVFSTVYLRKRGRPDMKVLPWDELLLLKGVQVLMFSAGDIISETKLCYFKIYAVKCGMLNKRWFGHPKKLLKIMFSYGVIKRCHIRNIMSSDSSEGDKAIAKSFEGDIYNLDCDVSFLINTALTGTQIARKHLPASYPPSPSECWFSKNDCNLM